jgi:thiol-disulfide isomerase/thioredoxin
MNIKIKYYSAPWCAPCKAFSPVVEEVCRENNIELIKIDIDENPQIAKDAGVRGIPTVVVEVDDAVKATLIGSSPKHGFEAWVAGCMSP